MNTVNRYCTVIPVFNNPKTIAEVTGRVLMQCPDVFVVDDGSDGPVSDILSAAGLDVRVIRHRTNRGKGAALRTGFNAAKEAGYTHVITIDADGQHFPEDMPRLTEASDAAPESVIVGCRSLTADNMPRGNTRANRFSNFWFRLYTGQNLEDTQSGYRVYPLSGLHGLRLLTSRYEAELELMVFAAWHGVRLQGVPVRVFYAPEGERVSHFRPFRDFMRITVLNTVLAVGALSYGLPSAMLRGFKRNKD